MMWQALFSPHGVMDRKVYMLGWLFWLCLETATLLGIYGVEKHSQAEAFWGLALLVVAALSMVSVVMLTMKRLRDLSLPPVAAFLTLVPFISLVMLIALSVMRGPDEEQ
jgi:uncharacterized membrane protein YhaH (DUF805 family)